MSENIALTRARLKTPKAGIASSVLLITIFWLLRRSVPADPLDPRSSNVSPAKLLSLLQSGLTHAVDELSHRAGRERDVLLKPSERDLWLQLLETVERRARLI
jgi:hypothetical protein